MPRRIASALGTVTTGLALQTTSAFTGGSSASSVSSSAEAAHVEPSWLAAGEEVGTHDRVLVDTPSS